LTLAELCEKLIFESELASQEALASHSIVHHLCKIGAATLT